MLIQCKSIRNFFFFLKSNAQTDCINCTFKPKDLTIYVFNVPNDNGNIDDRNTADFMLQIFESDYGFFVLWNVIDSTS